MSNEEVPAYIARHPECQHIRMATVDTPERKRDVAKEIAACVRDGYIVERVTVGFVRQNGFGECDVCNPPKKARKAAQKQQETLL